MTDTQAPVQWTTVTEYQDIRYEHSGDGIAKITINRPHVRNAFRPQTLVDIPDALVQARDVSAGAIILTGEAPDAFCSGADQNVRGNTGYLTEPGQAGGVGRFHVTDLQIQIRRLPKPVVAMDLVRTVVPLEDLETETVAWCREMLALSPFGLRLMKASFMAAEDGLSGIQQLAHDANLLFYATEEAKEGREAYKQKRRPEFERFPRRPAPDLSSGKTTNTNERSPAKGWSHV